MAARRIFRNSIVLRQVRMVALAAVAFGGFLAVLEFFLLIALARDAMIERQNQVLSLAEKPAASALWEFNDRLAADTLKGILRTPDIRQAMIVHTDGLPFASIGRGDERPPMWRVFAGRLIAGEHERVSRRLWVPSAGGANGTEVIGSLILVFDESRLIGPYLGIMRNSLIATFLGALLLVSMVAVIFDRFLTRPIVSIARQVDEVDPEDPQGRLLTVPPLAADTEIGQIAHKVNAMLILFGNAQRTLRRMATRDTSTNLPNRTLTLEHLVGLSRRAVPGKVTAVMAVLMDRLDELKDLIGHDEADAMATTLAARLLEIVGNDFFVGRIGVDCFVVVIENLDTVVQAVDHAKRLIDEVGKGDDMTTAPSVCVGIALYPDDGTGAPDLLRKAVAATAGARRKAQGRWNFFEDHLAERAHRQLMMEGQLRHALESREFVLHLQPQIDCGGAVVGAEALLRWQKDGDLVMPGTFIPLAEDSGLIVPIGDYVIEEACRMLEIWQDKGLDFTLAVNVSPRQLADPAFVARVNSAMERHGIRTGRLEMEITEYTLAAERGSLIERVQRLRQSGIRIALDDFGTGYSSLSYLRRFPVDVLKIDRSFVMDVPHDVAVPSTILTLANRLGMASVAEGIESAEQREWLVANGCDAMQGYLFSKPMPFADFMTRFGTQPVQELTANAM